MAPPVDDQPVARIRGLENAIGFHLGLTPQALCLRLLRRLKSCDVKQAVSVFLEDELR